MVRPLYPPTGKYSPVIFGSSFDTESEHVAFTLIDGEHAEIQGSRNGDSKRQILFLAFLAWNCIFKIYLVISLVKAV